MLYWQSQSIDASRDASAIGRTSAFAAMVDGLYIYVIDDGLRDFVITSNPTVLPLATRLWSVEAKDPFFRVGSSTFSRTFQAAAPFRRLLSYFVLNQTPDWDPILRTFDGDAVKLANIAVAYLQRDYFDTDTPNLFHVMEHLQNLFVMTYCPLISNAIYLKLGIQKVTSLLKSLASRTFPSHLTELAGCISTCCLFLRDNLERSDGLSRIISALQAGVLIGLLRCAPSLPPIPGMKDNHYFIMAEQLPKYLLYPSVLRVAAKALEAVKASGVETQMVRRGRFWNAWVTYKGLVRKRLALQAEIDPEQRVKVSCNYSPVS